ncbi:MAG: SRPBCC domain-containing protein, partial [Polyangiaceae bacterium]
EMSWIVAARPTEVYEHWMSSEGHAAMTGGGAQVEARVGGRFTAWHGYIEGVTKKLERKRRIVQTWRTTDFSRRTPDSRIDVELRAHKGQTQILLRHTKLKRGDGAKYTEGWYTFYLQPMIAYFAKKNG